jgi:hypothetical protein
MYLLIGTVITKAMPRDKASPHQNLGCAGLTSNAFGIRNSTVLSTTSIVAIDTVSVAAVIFIDSFTLSTCFLTPRYVSAYPTAKARIIAKGNRPTLCHPRSDDMSIPRTSPIPQPIRQWAVCRTACFVSESLINSTHSL